MTNPFYVVDIRGTKSCGAFDVHSTFCINFDSRRPTAWTGSTKLAISPTLRGILIDELIHKLPIGIRNQRACD